MKHIKQFDQFFEKRLSEISNSPFPENYHEILKKNGIEYPQGHEEMRKQLKKIATEEGFDKAANYVIELYPKLKKYKEELISAMKADNLDKPIKFIKA